jgi:hypothetical protein
MRLMTSTTELAFFTLRSEVELGKEEEVDGQGGRKQAISGNREYFAQSDFLAGCDGLPTEIKGESYWI